jgi:hypothetical protein
MFAAPLELDGTAHSANRPHECDAPGCAYNNSHERITNAILRGPFPTYVIPYVIQARIFVNIRKLSLVNARAAQLYGGNRSAAKVP